MDFYSSLRNKKWKQIRTTQKYTQCIQEKSEVDFFFFFQHDLSRRWPSRLSFSSLLEQKYLAHYPEFKIFGTTVIADETNNDVVFEDVQNISECTQYLCSSKLSHTLLWILIHKQLSNSQYVANIKLRGRPYSLAGSNQSVRQDFTTSAKSFFIRLPCLRL